MRLGLAGEQPRAGRRPHRHHAPRSCSASPADVASDAGLVLLGVALGTVGAIASWTGQHHDGSTTLIGLATAFLLVELVAYATRDDEFWSIPSGIVAHVTEWLAGSATFAAIVPILARPVLRRHRAREPAIATLVLGAGWLVADRRRGSRGLVLAAVADGDLRRFGRRLRHGQRRRAGHHAHRTRRARRVQRPPSRLGRRSARRLVGARRGARVHRRRSSPSASPAA